jgi:DDE_Tnp_1-associated
MPPGPVAFRRTGIGLLGRPAPAGAVRLPCGRPTEPGSDPIGVATLPACEIRPGWVLSILRGCGAHAAGAGNPAATGRLATAHPCPWCCFHHPRLGITERPQEFTRVHPSGLPRCLWLPGGTGALGRCLRASHPAVPGDACQSGDRHRALAWDHVTGIGRPSCQRIRSPHGPSCRTPATPSSPIPAALTHLTHTNPVQLQDADAPHLLTYLAAVPDPRAARGRRHPLVAIVGLAAAAVLAGSRSIAAIAEWAADAPQPIRAALGAGRDAPDHFAVPAEATIRRTLSRLDAAALAAAVGAWLTDRERPGPAVGRRRAVVVGRRRAVAVGRRRAVAVDGKTLRGARGAGADGRQAHLLACMDHTSRAVLANARLPARPRRSPPSPRCWRPWTWLGWWSPPTPSRPTPRPPSSWWASNAPTTCSSSRPTSPAAGALPAPALASRPGAGPHR